MTEKVILTREQEKAFKAFMGVADAPNRMEKFLRERGSWRDIYSPLQTLTVEEMAKLIFLKEYEVEENFDVGDWVVVDASKRDNIACQIHHITEGDSINLDYGDGFRSYWNTADLRHATPEEIKAEKERRTWAKIGREVGEFRDGDLSIGKDGFEYKTIQGMNAAYKESDLKGFYPAESFISFGGGEE